MYGKANKYDTSQVPGEGNIVYIVNCLHCQKVTVYNASAKDRSAPYRSWPRLAGLTFVYTTKTQARLTFAVQTRLQFIEIGQYGLYRVYQKKVYSWKMFPKLTSAQNSPKRSVSLGGLAPSGTSSTKFI